MSRCTWEIHFNRAPRFRESNENSIKYDKLRFESGSWPYLTATALSVVVDMNLYRHIRSRQFMA
eukprot:SAG31_NODE_5321_length_2612_cov_2.787505_1_plen_63_part_10